MVLNNCGGEQKIRKHGFIRIAAGAIALLFILAGSFIVNSFAGNPLSAHIAKGKAAEYLNRYARVDLKIKKVTYNPKDSSYLISVSSDESIDTHFFLSCRGGEIYNDDYDLSVLSGMNTMDRFCQEYKKGLTSLVQAKVNNVTNISVLPEKLAKYELKLDSAFDKRLVQNVSIVITCTGGTGAAHLAGVLGITHDVMKENGYAAAEFAIMSEYETELVEVKNIKPAHLESGNLQEILQKAIDNNEYDGITVFSKVGKM